MTHKITKTYGDTTVTVEGDTQFDAIKKLSFYDDVLSNRTCIGKDDQGNWVSSDKTIFTWRKDSEDNEYLGMRCVEPKSHPLGGCQAAIGKLKKPEGMVYFNQKAPEGQEGFKGWYKYNPEARRNSGGYGNNVPQQQSNYNPGYQAPAAQPPASSEDVPF